MFQLTLGKLVVLYLKLDATKDLEPVNFREPAINTELGRKVSLGPNTT